MKYKTVQDLVDSGHEDLVIFSEFDGRPQYDGCIIGVTTDDRAVYSLARMIEWEMKESNCSYDDALDYIIFNTIGSLGYGPEGKPVVLDDTLD